MIRGRHESAPEGAKHPKPQGMSLANLLREAKGGACPEWCLDKEILEKNARNKIRAHQCLPIVEKVLEKPK